MNASEDFKLLNSKKVSIDYRENKQIKDDPGENVPEDDDILPSEWSFSEIILDVLQPSQFFEVYKIYKTMHLIPQLTPNSIDYFCHFLAQQAPSNVSSLSSSSTFLMKICLAYLKLNLIEASDLLACLYQYETNENIVKLLFKAIHSNQPQQFAILLAQNGWIQKLVPFLLPDTIIGSTVASVLSSIALLVKIEVNIIDEMFSFLLSSTSLPCLTNGFKFFSNLIKKQKYIAQDLFIHAAIPSLLSLIEDNQRCQFTLSFFNQLFQTKLIKFSEFQERFTDLNFFKALRTIPVIESDEFFTVLQILFSLLEADPQFVSHLLEMNFIEPLFFVANGDFPFPFIEIASETLVCAMLDSPSDYISIFIENGIIDIIKTQTFIKNNDIKIELYIKSLFHILTIVEDQEIIAAIIDDNNFIETLSELNIKYSSSSIFQHKVLSEMVNQILECGS